MNDSREEKQKIRAWKNEFKQLQLKTPVVIQEMPALELAEAAPAASEAEVESARSVPPEWDEEEASTKVSPREPSVLAEASIAAPAPEPTLVRPNPIEEASPLTPMVAAASAPGANALFEVLAPASPAPKARSVASAPVISHTTSTTQKENSQTINEKSEDKHPLEVAANSKTSRAVREALRGSDFVDGNSEGDPETVYGIFTVDPKLDSELAAVKGHIELHLVPVDRTDATTKDTKFIDYSYPSAEHGDDFTIPAGTLHGNYRLYARVYLPDVGPPVASIPYRDIVTPFTREQIKFHISKRQYDDYFTYAAKIPSSDLFLHLSVFEGVQGNPKLPKRIANAEVRVLGFPEWGVFTSDPDGNVRIPKVPSHSELLIAVKASGYYATDRVVPIFAVDPVAVVYLIPKDTVQSITEYFTKALQSENKSVVMGRVFDPLSRKFLKGEKISLQYRKGPALYIDALPNLTLSATSSTGLFGFFNIVPSIRSVFREALGKWSYLLNIRPNSGYFVDIGRDGKKDLKVRLFDTLNGVQPEARLRVVGNEKEVLETDGKGTVVFSDLDIPSGIFPVEVDSPNYPRFIYSIPFDPQEKIDEAKLFLADEKLFKDSHQEFARISQLDPSKGAVMGGAEPSLFASVKGCVSIELLDSEQRPVPKRNGPFTWGKRTDDRNGLCLNAQNPRYAFYELPPGQYLSRWVTQEGKVLRAHVFYVGKNRPAMVIN